ncbi:MAG: molybdenum cofactor biosynthesis protein MoaE [Chloroflexota bacterium]
MSGKTICKILESSVNLEELLEELSFPSTGAVVIFSGLVRGLTNGKNPHNTAQLEYEAYQPMAEKMMYHIADEIHRKWPDIESIAIIQRTGKFSPGEPTVTIACSAAHRDTGVFDAARYGIDRLKEIVPVWKKEYSSQGEIWIEGDYIPKPGE